LFIGITKNYTNKLYETNYKDSPTLFGNGVKLMLIISILSCGGEDDDVQSKPQSTSFNKIMPLGASRVEGARPEFESFRFELWNSLD